MGLFWENDNRNLSFNSLSLLHHYSKEEIPLFGYIRWRIQFPCFCRFFENMKLYKFYSTLSLKTISIFNNKGFPETRQLMDFIVKKFSGLEEFYSLRHFSMAWQFWKYCVARPPAMFGQAGGAGPPIWTFIACLWPVLRRAALGCQGGESIIVSARPFRSL